MMNNKDIVAHFIKATNEKKWEMVLNLVQPDFVRHSSSNPREITTDQGIIAFHKAELETFPDLQETILFCIEEGDMVAARINFSGTQLGNLGPFYPTGNKMTADYNCFFRIVSSKIKETWVEYDNLNGLIQLGHYKLS